MTIKANKQTESEYSREGIVLPDLFIKKDENANTFKGMLLKDDIVKDFLTLNNNFDDVNGIDINKLVNDLNNKYIKSAKPSVSLKKILLSMVYIRK